MKKFLVKVQRTVVESAIIVVEADSPGQARRLGIEAAEEDDTDIDWRVGDCDLEVLKAEGLMATDYFAHYVYGKYLDDADHDQLQELRDEFEEGLHEDRWDDYEESSPDEQASSFLSWLDESKKGWVDGLRKKHKAPDYAGLIWTGDEDDRPGRCQVEAGTWLLGVGIQNTIGRAELATWEGAEWLGWVTAG